MGLVSFSPSLQNVEISFSQQIPFKSIWRLTDPSTFVKIAAPLFQWCSSYRTAIAISEVHLNAFTVPLALSMAPP